MEKQSSLFAEFNTHHIVENEKTFECFIGDA